jgi:hypothetical protein
MLWMAYPLHIFPNLHIICVYNLIGTVINKFKSNWEDATVVIHNLGKQESNHKVSCGLN